MGIQKSASSGIISSYHYPVTSSHFPTKTLNSFSVSWLNSLLISAWTCINLLIQLKSCMYASYDSGSKGVAIDMVPTIKLF